MKIAVYNQNAEQVGDVELNAKIFEVKTSRHLITEAVRVQSSNARKGLANTKNRGEVSGGGKKPWKQKGTGRARAGSNRSPIWRHGGVTFGPTSDRNWSLKMNKKAKTKALFMTLSEKANTGNLIVIDAIKLDAVKTKAFAALMQTFQDKMTLGKKKLFLLPKKDETLVRVSRNLTTVKPAMASSLNVIDILHADTIVMMRDSLPVIEKTYLRASNTGTPAKANYTKAALKAAAAEAKK